MCQLNINYMNKPQISAQQLKRSISFQYQFCSWMCKTGNYSPRREVRFCSTQSRRTQADRGLACRPYRATKVVLGVASTRKWQTSLLATFHWPESGHRVSCSCRGSWEVQSLADVGQLNSSVPVAGSPGIWQTGNDLCHTLIMGFPGGASGKEVKVAQSHLTLGDPMDYMVHGIFQNTGVGSRSLV